MRFKALFILGLSVSAALLATAAWAQGRGDDDAPKPTGPLPPGVVAVPVDAKPSMELQFSPSVTLDNGVMKAKVFLPDHPDSFYHGTRFDSAGTIGSLVYGGIDFYKPWFEAFADVRDYVETLKGTVAGFASADAGPVEEFSTDGKALGYEEAPVGGTFVKIGVGLLRKADDQAYTQFRNYALVDAGTKSVKSTKNSVTFTQDILDPSSGYGYHYVKTLTLVPGKPQLLIAHQLKNTGKKAFTTTVFDHNFLTISAGDAGVKVTVPYTIAAQARPADPTLYKVDDHSVTYLRPITLTERGTIVSLSGFGNTASDYNIDIANTRTGAAVNVKGDKPMVANMLFSTHAIAAVEPRISMDLPVGAENRWTYTYTYTAPK